MPPPRRLPRRLFLELTLDGERHCFEFLAGDDRAVAVGSSPRADICVARLGVSPIAFHLERDRDEIHVMPGYATELRLNSAVVRRRATLSARATLEFQGIALRARISSERPEGSPDRPAPERPRRELFVQALDAPTVPVHVGDLHTAPPAPSSLPPPSLPLESALAAPLPSIDTQTTAVEVVRPSRVAAATPPPRKGQASLAEASARGATAAGRSVARAREAWLTRLGLLTKARPLPVLVIALGVALLFGAVVAVTTSRFVPAPSGSGNAPAPPAAPPAPDPEKVVTPSAGALERARAAARTSDPALAGAVAALGAGRYAEAALAYSSVAAKAPDPEVYRAIARLLEKASSPGCTPNHSATPRCPEVRP